MTTHRILSKKIKDTSISELQNIKIQRDNYNVHTFKQDKYKYIL